MRRIAEIVVNTLPRSRTRHDLHRHAHYYPHTQSPHRISGRPIALARLRRGAGPIRATRRSCARGLMSRWPASDRRACRRFQGAGRGPLIPCVPPEGEMMKKTDAPEALLAAASQAKPMTRSDVTEMIVMARIRRGITWAKLAKAIGQSKEWTTAALLGQMQMTKEQAEKAGRLLGLPEDAVLLLQQVPYKGSLPTAVPTDPLIYRWYEIVNVYGTTIKA
jgi:cyanate lyase